MGRVTRRSVASKEETTKESPKSAGRRGTKAEKPTVEDASGDSQETPKRSGRQAAKEVQKTETPAKGGSTAKGRSTSRSGRGKKEEPESKETENDEEVEEGKTPRGSTSRSARGKKEEPESNENEVEGKTPRGSTRSRGKGKAAQEVKTAKAGQNAARGGRGAKAAEVEDDEDEESKEKEADENNVSVKGGRTRGKASVVTPSPRVERRSRGKAAVEQENEEAMDEDSTDSKKEDTEQPKLKTNEAETAPKSRQKRAANTETESSEVTPSSGAKRARNQKPAPKTSLVSGRSSRRSTAVETLADESTEDKEDTTEQMDTGEDEVRGESVASEKATVKDEKKESSVTEKVSEKKESSVTEEKSSVTEKVSEKKESSITEEKSSVTENVSEKKQLLATTGGIEQTEELSSTETAAVEKKAALATEEGSSVNHSASDKEESLVTENPEKEEQSTDKELSAAEEVQNMEESSSTENAPGETEESLATETTESSITEITADKKDKPSVTEKPADKKDESSITGKTADKKDESSITGKIADKKDESSITGKTADKKDESSITEKTAHEKDEPSITEKTADKKDESSITEKTAHEKDEPSITDKAEDEPSIAKNITDEKDEPSITDKAANKKDEPSITEKITDKKDEPSITENTADGKDSPPFTEKSADANDTLSITDKAANEKVEPSTTEKAEEMEETSTPKKAAAEKGESTTEKAAVGKGESTTEKAAAEKGESTTENAEIEKGESTTEKAAVGNEPSTSEMAVEEASEPVVSISKKRKLEDDEDTEAVKPVSPNKRQKLDDGDNVGKQTRSDKSELTQKDEEMLEDFVVVGKDDAPAPDSTEVAASLPPVVAEKPLQPTTPEDTKQDRTVGGVVEAPSDSVIIPPTGAELDKQIEDVEMEEETAIEAPSDVAGVPSAEPDATGDKSSISVDQALGGSSAEQIKESPISISCLSQDDVSQQQSANSAATEPSSAQNHSLNSSPGVDSNQPAQPLPEAMELESSESPPLKLTNASSDNTTHLTQPPSQNGTTEESAVVNCDPHLDATPDKSHTVYVPSSTAIDSRKFILNPTFPIEMMDPAYCFSVVSYNILADCHLSRSDYSYTQPQYLVQDYRHSLLLKELDYLDGDLVCLQEVSPSYYTQTLLPDMKSRGYDGYFIKRTKEYWDEGEATFVRTSKFDIVAHQSVSLKDLAFKAVDTIGLPEGVSSSAKKYLDRADVILLTELRCKKTKKSLSVCNIHVVHDLKAPDVQCVQVALAIKQLVAKAGNDLSPHIICGDFNSGVTSPVYQLVRDGNLSEDHIRKLQALETLDNTDGSARSLVHHMRSTFQHTSTNLKNAYELALGKEPPVTAYSKTPKSVDHIFHSSTSVDNVGVLETLDLEVLKATGGLPTKSIPSDHVSIKAVFRLK